MRSPTDRKRIRGRITKEKLACEVAKFVTRGYIENIWVRVAFASIGINSFLTFYLLGRNRLPQYNVLEHSVRGGQVLDLDSGGRPQLDKGLKVRAGRHAHVLRIVKGEDSRLQQTLMRNRVPSSISKPQVLGLSLQNSNSGSQYLR